VLQVTDDGVGFDVEADEVTGRFGIPTMRERVALLDGSFTISAQKDVGTSVTARIPMEVAA
jgi:two-component system sensor histidine kinase DegS